MLNAAGASDNPSRIANGTASHQFPTTNTSRTYEADEHPRTMADFAYICGQSRGLRPVLAKYFSTRLRRARRNSSGFWNFSGADLTCSVAELTVLAES